MSEPIPFAGWVDDEEEMNAYELADELQDLHGLYCEDAANMLRQQADRIAELESEVSHLKHINKNWSISEGWALQRIAELESCLDFALQDTMDYIRLNNLGGENNHWIVWARKLLVNATPQTKPLSDEEIKDLALKYGLGYSVISFARAIEERHGIK